VAAALAAGGTMMDDSNARSWWVLADADGNEACISTWQDR
jgi:4a-hydroxytetrahydrobiopterin dehydratase